VYSIDESFLDFHGYEHIDLQKHCLELREKVLKGLDLPTSIGLAPTKTLAKVANKIAKKFPEKTNGVYSIDTLKKLRKPSNGSPRRYLGHREKILRKIFGKRHQNRLGLYPTARSFRPKRNGNPRTKNAPRITRNTTIRLDHSKTQKGIATTRTFDKRTDDLETLKERVSTFAYKCSEKLRAQNLAADT
jgi:DNA polymerase V